MLSALLYLQAATIRNRLAVRLRRLRQPRYLVGAVVGGLYLASVFSRGFLNYGSRGSAGAFPMFPPEVWELLASLALFVYFLLTWLVPHERAALVFSEAEIAFLFPAPVRRSTLVQYKLIKSQLGILFTVLFLTLVSPRPGGMEGAAMRAVGWWILLSTIQLHTLGSSFARTILLERGVSNWRRRLLFALLMAGFICAALVWGGRGVPAPQADDIQGVHAVGTYLLKIAVSDPAVWLLAPFRLVAGPFLAPTFATFLAALGPALLILGLHYLWVLRSDVAFEEASVDASQRQALRIAHALKTGQRARGAQPWRKRRAPFPLAPRGSPSVAILWKNLLAAGQFFSLRVWLIFAAWAGVVGVMMGKSLGATAWPEIAASLAEVLLGGSVLLGPQLCRYDFRHDLAVADLLKSYPMKGWQVALGEVLAPALIMTGAQWLLLALIAALRTAVASGYADADSFAPLSLPLAGAIIVPGANLVLLLIPNAAAVLLPGWFAVAGSAGGGRGIEVIGQRLIFVLGQFAVLLVAFIPAGAGFFLAKVLVADTFLPPFWALPVGAVAAGAVLGVEFFFGLMALGHWFEQYDLSAEQLA